MKTEKIIVANLKCKGCASTIKKELLQLDGVKNVDIDIEEASINISFENIERSLITNTLNTLGYPEATEKNGLLRQMKSYTSCMIGKMKTKLIQLTFISISCTMCNFTFLNHKDYRFRKKDFVWNINQKYRYGYRFR